MAMKFQEDGWGWMSDCGKFSIRDQSTKEKPLFILWRMHRGRVVERPIGDFDSLEKAIERADIEQDSPVWKDRMPPWRKQSKR